MIPQGESGMLARIMTFVSDLFLQVGNANLTIR